jgi:hypothetical protein
VPGLIAMRLRLPARPGMAAALNPPAASTRTGTRSAISERGRGLWPWRALLWCWRADLAVLASRGESRQAAQAADGRPSRLADGRRPDRCAHVPAEREHHRRVRAADARAGVAPKPPARQGGSTGERPGARPVPPPSLPLPGRPVAAATVRPARSHAPAGPLSWSAFSGQGICGYLTGHPARSAPGQVFRRGAAGEGATVTKADQLEDASRAAFGHDGPALVGRRPHGPAGTRPSHLRPAQGLHPVRDQDDPVTRRRRIRRACEDEPARAGGE